MDKVDKKIETWDNSFNRYIELECKSNLLINGIDELKNNLKKLIGNQKKDDILFYKSMLENSSFYLTNSLKIRKLKFQKDLTYIIKMIDKEKNITEVNKPNFQSLTKDYKKLVEEYYQAKKNSPVYAWIKDEKLESFSEIENDMTEIMEYHLNLMSAMYNMVKVESDFYCGPIAILSTD
jgi:hypothetical protein